MKFQEKKNMKLCKIILLLLGIIIIFSGCQNSKAKSESDMSDTIVIYFSFEDNTKDIAKEISNYLHCGSFEIKALEPYKSEDLKGKNRCYQEHIDNSLPDIPRLVPALSIYKTVIIGYPIWYGEAPNIVKSYIKRGGPFKGLRIIPFYTTKEKDITYSTKDLFKDEKAKVEEDKIFYNNPTKEEIHSWVDSLKI